MLMASQAKCANEYTGNVTLEADLLQTSDDKPPWRGSGHPTAAAFWKLNSKVLPTGQWSFMTI